MKYIKLITLFVCILFLSGCSINYNLTITDKKKVIESIDVLDNNDNLLNADDSILKFLNNQKEGIENDGYSAIIIEGDYESGLKIENNYSSLYSYVDSTYFKGLFEKANIREDDGLFTFETTGEYYRNDVFSADLDSQYLYNLDEIRINIKFYNVVDSHNADEVDEEKNVYTWILKADNPYDKISFSLTDEVRKDIMMSNFWKEKGYIVVIGVVVIIALLLGVFKIRSVMINNNKI